MGRSKKMSAYGCLLLLGLAGVGYLFSRHWMAGVIALGLFVFVIMKANAPCGVCGNTIKKSSYTWTIDGKEKRVCPKCNQTLESRQSKSATSKLLG